jgi:CO/xanthine dehydrogenase FAD-binding subunit
VAGGPTAVVFNKDQVVNAGVFLSGVGLMPWRSREVEEVITGSWLETEIIRRAAEATVQKARPIELNAYKILLLRSVGEEQLHAMAQEL